MKKKFNNKKYSLISLIILLLFSYILWSFGFWGFHWLFLQYKDYSDHHTFLSAIKWWYFFIAIPFTILTYFILVYFINKNLAHRGDHIKYLPLLKPAKSNEPAIKLNQNTYWLESSFNQHTMISGSTGRGKTNLLYTILKQRIEINKKAKVIFVNGKYQKSALKTELDILKLNYEFVDLKSNSTLYDVFITKNNSDIISMLLEFEDYTSVLSKEPSVAYYRRREKELMQHVFNLFIETKTYIYLDNLVEFFDKEKVKDLIVKLGLFNHEKYAWFKKYEKEIYERISGRMSDLQSIACLSKSFNDQKQKNTINITDFLNNEEKNILVFNLDTSKTNGVLLGKLIILDLIHHLALKNNPNQRIMVILDEFGSFASRQIDIMHQQFRSLKVEMVLSFQGINQLTNVSTEFRDDIINNTFNYFSFTILDPTTAEYLAKVFGTKQITEITHQIKEGFHTGMGSKKVVDQFHIHPNDLKTLDLASCVFKTIDAQKRICDPKIIKIDQVPEMKIYEEQLKKESKKYEK